jgi:hypothetical protein
MLPNGRRLEIEFKKGKGGRLSKDQLDYKEWVEEGGGVYLCLHGLPECKEKMKPLLDIDDDV